MSHITKTKENPIVNAKRSYPGDGRWIEKPRRSEVLVCVPCKGKYIKTRTGQTTCIKCMIIPREVR